MFQSELIEAWPLEVNIEASADVPQTAVPLAVTIGWLQERAIPHMLKMSNFTACLQSGFYGVFQLWEFFLTHPSGVRSAAALTDIYVWFCWKWLWVETVGLALFCLVIVSVSNWNAENLSGKKHKIRREPNCRLYHLNQRNIIFYWTGSAKKVVWVGLNYRNL